MRSQLGLLPIPLSNATAVSNRARDFVFMQNRRKCSHCIPLSLHFLGRKGVKWDLKVDTNWKDVHKLLWPLTPLSPILILYYYMCGATWPHNVLPTLSCGGCIFVCASLRSVKTQEQSWGLGVELIMVQFNATLVKFSATQCIPSHLVISRITHILQLLTIALFE